MGSIYFRLDFKLLSEHRSLKQITFALTFESQLRGQIGDSQAIKPDVGIRLSYESTK